MKFINNGTRDRAIVAAEFVQSIPFEVHDAVVMHSRYTYPSAGHESIWMQPRDSMSPVGERALEPAIGVGRDRPVRGTPSRVDADQVHPLRLGAAHRGEREERVLHQPDLRAHTATAKSLDATVLGEHRVYELLKEQAFLGVIESTRTGGGWGQGSVSHRLVQDTLESS